MKVLKPKADPDRFFESLRTAGRSILFLDYDGTLAPFRQKREEAVPYPGVIRTIRALLPTKKCRVVFISGRAIEDLLPLLGLDNPPEIWGSHGWERLLPGGTPFLWPLEEGARRSLRKADEWVRAQGLEEKFERKPTGLALHWRGLSEESIADLRGRAYDFWNTLVDGEHVVIREFDGGIELRVGGRTKGFAVRTVLSEAEEGTVAAYLGDDWTDEDAFHAMEGRGLRVLVRETERPSAADVWIRPPGELLDFLDRWTRAVGGSAND